jgi:archaellum component FlaC
MDINIHIHHHNSNDSINQKLDKIMASQQQFETALNRIDAATTAIATQLRDLKEQLTNAGLSADVEAQVLTRLETAATQLEAVGQSVENPVPPIPPLA